MNEDKKAMYVALCKAQSQFPEIKRTKTVQVRSKSGAAYSFAYAPLEALVAATRKALTENGIFVTQTIKDECVVTMLAHSSGDILELAPVKIISNGGGPQEYGSALTYSRRYSYALALSIVADDDDDGNIAEGNSVQDVQRAATVDMVKKVMGVKKEEPPEFGQIAPQSEAKRPLFEGLDDFMKRADALPPPVMQFGKHKGKLLAEIPTKSLEWYRDAIEADINKPEKAKYYKSNKERFEDILHELRGRGE